MKVDRIISIIFMLLSAWFIAETHQLGYTSAVFPKAMAILLFILSVILFSTSFFSKAKEQAKQVIVIKRGDIAYLLTIIGLSFIWIYTMGIFGFISTSVILLTIMTEVLSTRRPVKLKEVVSTIMIYSLLVGGAWFALAKFLAVPFPKGILI